MTQKAFKIWGCRDFADVEQQLLKNHRDDLKAGEMYYAASKLYKTKKKQSLDIFLKSLNRSLKQYIQTKRV